MLDFYQFLRDDTSPTTSALLREISEELSMQGIMPEVVAQLVEICYKNLENYLEWILDRWTLR